MEDSAEKSVQKSLDKHRDWLMGLPGVHAVWPDKDSLGVGVRDISPDTKRLIEGQVKVPVKYEVMGPFKGQSE